MWKPICTILLICAACGILVLSGCSQKNGEPISGGRPLSYWVNIVAITDARSPENKAAVNAIQEIGTNAIPYLLRWTSQASPAPPGQELASDPASLQAMATPAAFTALGTKGVPAIPALAKMLNEGDKLTSAYAGQSLGRLGAPALPTLIASLKNPRADVRKNAADFLIFMGTNALPAISALEEIHNDPDSDVQKAVANILQVLKSFGTNTPDR